ncbi:MAG TPA: hypothetical protein DDW17_09845 [Deltaproteobacteria bacterium]|nr:hypothetical protein [Deltaproteobacteria bacterium]
MLITNYQKKLIHTIVHSIGMPDEDYRGLLRRWFDVDTCLNLSYRQAEVMIQRLRYIAEKQGRWEHREGSKSKYEDFGEREGFASPKQLRMIEAMWCDVSYQPNQEAKLRALNKFVYGFFHISNMRFLEGWQAKKLIRALQEMKERPATRRRMAI